MVQQKGKRTGCVTLGNNLSEHRFPGDDDNTYPLCSLRTLNEMINVFKKTPST